MSGNGVVIPLLAWSSLYPSFVVFDFLVVVLRFTVHAFLDLFHPLYLADLFQLNVEGYPGAGHLGIDLTEAPFANASTGAVTHKLRALSFERIVRDRGALMNPTGLLSAFVFSWDDHAC
jgi:hypothetical protein